MMKWPPPENFVTDYTLEHSSIEKEVKQIDEPVLAIDDKKITYNITPLEDSIVKSPDEASKVVKQVRLAHFETAAALANQSTDEVCAVNGDNIPTGSSAVGGAACSDGSAPPIKSSSSGGVLGTIVAQVVMKVFYGAWVARPDCLLPDQVDDIL